MACGLREAFLKMDARRSRRIRAGVAGGSTLGVPDWYKEAMQE